MSLFTQQQFGSQPAQPVPPGTIFGLNSGNQQQNTGQTASPFGQQQNAGQTSSPFGSFGQQQSGAQRPSPFGTPQNQVQTQNQTSPRPTLFAPSANATLTPQQPTQTGGVFGNQATQNTQPAATGTGGGLLSGATLVASQPQQGLFGQSTANAATPQNQNQNQTSAFGLRPTLGTSTANQNAAASTNDGVLPQGNTAGYFESLLAKSKKQAQGESPLEDLPSLQLGLGDLRQRLRKLGPKTDPLQHGKAQYMLAASGVDPGAAVKDLKFFSATAQNAGRVERPGQPHVTTDLDVEAYLANLQSKTTLSMIADGLERSAKDFDNFLEDNITMEWDAQRKRVYEHFGIKPRDEGPGDQGVGTPGRESSGGFGRSRRNTKPSRSVNPNTKGSTLGRSTLQKSVIGTPSKIGAHQSEFKDVENATGSPAAAPSGSANDDRLVREKQGRLAECVRSLNLARLEKTPYPILHELANVENKSGDRHAQQLVDAYHAAMYIVGENPDAEGFAGDETARERQFKDSYMDPNEKSAASVQMRKRILDGANRFLEMKFFREVENVIAKHPREAALGGRPDVISKIQAYVRLRHIRKDLVPDNVELQDHEGEYVWAVVFFLLRSGHINEAAQYVKSQSTLFRTIDRTFASYLLEYVASPERRLRRQLQDRCNNEYNQRARNAPENSIDPFRMACYKVIGRCDVSNRSLDNLNTEIDDWIWLQFNLARENDKATEVAAESYGLQDLRTSIREIGLKHFPKTPNDDNNATFAMFFYLQILAGMFEQAISYLYTFSYVDAIHFAIGLEYYGLIRPADPWTTHETLLSFDTRGRPQLSFGRMLGYYTRDFRAADVASAVDYLTLICLNADLGGEAGRQQAELCHAALRELVLETREFSKLIGDIRPDGRRIRGLIEERGPLIGLREEDDFVRTVTLQAARFADDNGRTTDAVLLYHLAGDYDSVVTIVSRALSEAISLEIGEDPMRLLPVKPRATGKEYEARAADSLSLASIDDPFKLALTMMSMYEKDAMFSTKIESQNRIACHLLLQMSEIKGLVETGQWPEALDVSALDLL
jgi:nuclear pore complex protein Nup93